jgi:anti-sigma-K factor RskA
MASINARRMGAAAPTFMRLGETFRNRGPFASLCVYHKTEVPSQVTKSLKIKPTESQLAGRSYQRRGKQATYSVNGWFLASEGKCKAADLAEHVEWILNQLKGRQPALADLRRRGYWIRLVGFWDSPAGHGGPRLSAALMARMADLELGLWLDCYFAASFVWRDIVEAESARIPSK